ncbi:MAG: efflux RND transporter periplasmic adaptor subunit [Deltaproteobacteria bacterium]|nr:efflux RND transporter periplasmic adaptor subunit [Deltaproteobacteria bacterium]
MKRVLTLLVLVGLVGVPAWWLTRPRPPVDVTVIALEKGDVRIVINGSSAGEVTPDQRTLVRGELPGTVERVLRRRGDRVARGDLVLALDPRDARARLAQAEAAVEVARAGVAAARTRQDGARRMQERTAQLVERGGAPKVELERLEVETAAAGDGVRLAEAQVRQAEAAITQARLALARMELRAPFGGVLQDVFVAVGTQVTPGVPLFDLVDDTHVYVTAPIDEVDAPRVRVGQPVLVTFDSLRTEELPGVVRAVAPAIGRDERLSRMLRIEVELQGAPPLRVGAAANVAVVERVVSGATILPTMSVQGRGVERTVMVVADVDAQGAGTLRRRKIRTGANNDDVTEVLSGVDPQDRVVHAPNDPAIREGVRARPVPLARAATLPGGLAGLQDGRPPRPAAPDTSTPDAAARP